MAFQKERRVLQVKLVVPFVFENKSTKSTDSILATTQ